MKKASLLVLCLTFLCGASAAFAADPFPYRSRYPDAPVIETADLVRRINDVMVVDVRSDYEFATLRINNAINIPLTDRDFVQQVKELRAKSNKPIVFYCNGVTCHKSYDAVLLAKNNRIDNVFVYDAGVFAWAKDHPQMTVLLGKSPIDPANLISEDRFKAHLLSPKDFSDKAADGAIVLDVRDRIQRDSPLFPLKEHRAQLDEKRRIEVIIEQAIKERKTLLVYDAVGKQVQWFQYELEGKGLKDYYFMKGGAQAFWDYRLGKVTLTKEDPKKAEKSR